MVDLTSHLRFYLQSFRTYCLLPDSNPFSARVNLGHVPQMSSTPSDCWVFYLCLSDELAFIMISKYGLKDPAKSYLSFKRRQSSLLSEITLTLPNLF